MLTWTWTYSINNEHIRKFWKNISTIPRTRKCDILEDSLEKPQIFQIFSPRKKFFAQKQTLVSKNEDGIPT